ncbi:MAG: hypothetical protein K2O32_15220 [Acetatifactor sp.]|nr:hypothetical protein [Acetatifactor sp.]
MLQTLINIFNANILPVCLFMGVCGFVMTLVGDWIKKRATFPKEGETVTADQLRTAKYLHVGLNIGGWALLFVAFALLWAGGYYEGILDRLFPG